MNNMDPTSNDENELMRLYTNGWIGLSDYEKSHKPIVDKIKELTDKLKSLRNKNITLNDFNKITEFDEDKVYKFLSSIVIGRWNIEFHFYNGITIKKEFTNQKRRKR